MRRSKMNCVVRSVFLAAVLVPGAWTHAQGDRFELGRRVTALETVWLKTADAERRAAALPLVDNAVRSFFGLAFANAAHQLDLARRTLSAEVGSGWADSLSVLPDQRIVAPGVETIGWTVQRAYSHAAPVPTGARLELRIGDAAPEAFELTEELPQRIAMPWGHPEGDVAVDIRLVFEGRVLVAWTDQVSVIADLERRLSRLERHARREGSLLVSDETPEQISDQSPNRWNATIRATVLDFAATARRLEQGATPETAVPAHRRLRHLEAWYALEPGEMSPEAEDEPRKGDAAFLEPGDHRFILASRSGQTPIRWQIPPAAVSAETPVVFALHGAGGSENLFFEAYGAGRIRDLCRERGWLLIAPRRIPFGGVELDEVIGASLDLLGLRGRPVLAVGHSMGAMELTHAAVTHRALFRGVACVGGGGRLPDFDGAKSLPFWIAAGDRDFGRIGARRLHEEIVENGGLSEWHEVPNCEHLLVMAEALPGVFEFFDRVTD